MQVNSAWRTKPAEQSTGSSVRTENRMAQLLQLKYPSFQRPWVAPLIAHLEVSEGVVRDRKGHKAYKDSEGYWTIGIGRNLDAAPVPGWDPSKADSFRLSDDEVIYYLAEDIAKHYKSAVRDFPIIPHIEVTDPIRVAVLVELSFNLGSVAKKWPNTVARFNKTGDFDRLASDIRANAKWRGQVKGRADRIIDRLENPQRYTV